MRYYTVPTIGTGTYTDPYRPDLPTGTSWVGQDHPEGTYLIATPNALPAKAGRTERPPVAQLANEASRRGLDTADVEQWWVS